ncbi:MAG: LysE family translocator [Alphaproteobacteria bacterium]
MMSLELYLGFVLASAVVVLVPGPSVTVIVANGASHGTRAGFATLAGNTTGVAILLVALIAGFAPIMHAMSAWFDWFKLAGALYLIWLGITRLRAPSTIEPDTAARFQARGFFRQGFLVGMSNPKLLLFFAVFFPQFMDPAGSITRQLVILAVTFLVVAAILDGGYALAAGRAGRWLRGRRAQLLNRISGGVLIGGGLWLALVRR